MTGAVCRRCLLADMDAEGLRQTVQRRIDQLPAEQRTDATVYQARLGVCLSCDSLINGLCGMCGCFIELRAARRSQHCPAGRWG